MRYNRTLKILIFFSVTIIILAVYCVWLFAQKDMYSPLPDNGKLQLVDGEHITISDTGYSLSLDSFQHVGETQVCTFVFKNENSAPAHSVTTFTCNNKYFTMDGEPSFTVSPNETFEYTVAITLIEYPDANENLPISINFNTTYY